MGKRKFSSPINPGRSGTNPASYQVNISGFLLGVKSTALSRYVIYTTRAVALSGHLYDLVALCACATHQCIFTPHVSLVVSYL